MISGTRAARRTPSKADGQSTARRLGAGRLRTGWFFIGPTSIRSTASVKACWPARSWIKLKPLSGNQCAVSRPVPAGPSYRLPGGPRLVYPWATSRRRSHHLRRIRPRHASSRAATSTCEETGVKSTAVRGAYHPTFAALPAASDVPRRLLQIRKPDAIGRPTEATQLDAIWYGGHVRWGTTRGLQ